jgi:hypothetical protein
VVSVYVTFSIKVPCALLTFPIKLLVLHGVLLNIVDVTDLCPNFTLSLVSTSKVFDLYWELSSSNLALDTDYTD